MKSLEKILDTLCIICTIIFFLAVTVMVLAQFFAVITLNGTLSVSLLKTIAGPAGLLSGITTVVAIALAYIRGQMAS